MKKKVFETARDIIIPQGTKVTFEPPHTENHAQDLAIVGIAVTRNETAYWRMNWQDAIETGMVKERE